jgi:hypothetical protein
MTEQSNLMYISLMQMIEFAARSIFTLSTPFKQTLPSLQSTQNRTNWTWFTSRYPGRMTKPIVLHGLSTSQSTWGEARIPCPPAQRIGRRCALVNTCIFSIRTLPSVLFATLSAKLHSSWIVHYTTLEWSSLKGLWSLCGAMKSALLVDAGLDHARMWRMSLCNGNTGYEGSRHI